MTLQILNEPPPEPADVARELQRAIGAAIADAQVEVAAAAPGHFEVTVRAAAFAKLSRVKQQQLVYRAIAHLMHGANPPVHAIDKMTTATLE